jgi:DNA-binding Lrp family transcriptional regulator
MTDIEADSFALDATDLQLLAELQRDASRSNQDLAAAVQVSPATCLRRIKRLREAGLIEHHMAIIHADKLAAIRGHGLAAVVEVSLDQQGDEHARAFEARVVQDDEVQQCWRVSPGPDFVLVVQVRDMPAYAALAQRLFTSQANVRNVKAFFSLRRAKFRPQLPL